MSQKQIDARTRNWKIFQLRGIYRYAKFTMTGENSQTVIEVVDKELKLLGAKTNAELWAEFEKEML